MIVYIPIIIPGGPTNPPARVGVVADDADDSTAQFKDVILNAVPEYSSNLIGGTSRTNPPFTYLPSRVVINGITRTLISLEVASKPWNCITSPTFNPSNVNVYQCTNPASVTTTTTTTTSASTTSSTTMTTIVPTTTTTTATTTTVAPTTTTTTTTTIDPTTTTTTTTTVQVPTATITTTTKVPTLTTTTTTTTTTTKSPTTTTTVLPTSCASGIKGKKNGDGYNGDCCSSSNDCINTCVKGVCNGPKKPISPPTKCIKGQEGKKQGKGSKNYCCVNSKDCRDTCNSGICN